MSTDLYCNIPRNIYAVIWKCLRYYSTLFAFKKIYRIRYLLPEANELNKINRFHWPCSAIYRSFNIILNPFKVRVALLLSTLFTARARQVKVRVPVWPACMAHAAKSANGIAACPSFGHGRYPPKQASPNHISVVRQAKCSRHLSGDRQQLQPRLIIITALG